MKHGCAFVGVNRSKGDKKPRSGIHGLFRILLLLGVLGSASLARGMSDVRVALVTTCPSEAPLKAIPLAEAELAQADGVVLVERTQIDQVLREQKTCLLYDGSRAVEVGQLLSADVFAVVENYGKDHEAVALVVFDAERGIRLQDMTLSTKDLEATTRGIVEGVQEAVRKFRIAPGLETVCLVSVRNANLPRERDSFCRTVGNLLERRLVQAPVITVVERKRLDQLNKERRLPGASGLNQLLGSSTMLELALSARETSEEVAATVYFTDQKGETTDKVVVTGDLDAPALAGELMVRVCEALGSAPPPEPFDRLQEAKRFRQEANYNANYDRLLEAWQAAEAALALAPEDDGYWIEAAGHMFGYTQSIVYGEPEEHTNLVSSLNAAESALALCHAVKSKYGNYDGLFTLQRKIGQLLGSRKLYRSKHHTDDTRQTASALRQSFLDLWGFRDDPREAAAKYLKKSGIWNVGVLMRMLAGCSESSEEFLSLAFPAMDSWLEEFSKPQAYKKMALLYFSREVPDLADPNVVLGPFKRDRVYYRGMTDMIEKMEEHSHPVVRLYGQIGGLMIRRHYEALSKNDYRMIVKSIDKACRAVIEEPGKQPGLIRLYAYRAAVDAYGYLLTDFYSIKDYDLKLSLSQDLFNFMISRNELFFNLCDMLTNPDSGVSESYYPQLLDNVNRIIKRLNEGAWRAAISSKDKRRLNDKYFGTRKEAILAKLGPGELSSPRPWRSARKLMDTRELSEIESLCNPIVADDRVYAIGYDTYWHSGEVSDIATAFEVLRCDLSGGPAKRFRRTATGGILDDDKTSENWYDNKHFPNAVLADDRIFISSGGQGIFIVPLDGSAVKRIGTKDGLPSDHIHELAVVGRDLYFGCGHQGKAGYFVRYDLDNERVEIIASSLNKEKKTPLDNTKAPFYIQGLRYDKPRGRLVMWIDCGHYDVSSWIDEDAKSRVSSPFIGLHEYDLTSGHINHLSRYDWSTHWGGSLQGARMLISPTGINPAGTRFPWTGILEYDLESDTAGVLYTFSRTSSFNHSSADPQGDWNGHKLLSRDQIDPPYLIHDNWIYFHHEDFGRLSLKDGTKEFFPELGLKRLRKISPTRMHFEWIEEKQSMLVSDDKAVWILGGFRTP